MSKKADIGLIGLAVMGQNLVLNMNDHGYSVAVFNRTTSKVDEFLADAAKGRSTIIGTHSLEELVASLSIPRKVMLMVKAGDVVDQFIEQLLPLLQPGDVIIDGGNSHYPDTTRRTRSLKEKGILYIGTGVSGGEEGARLGPSIMPGGNYQAWPLVKPILQDISAKVGEGIPCCDWVGEEGAGHYVKMVHNGIEYGDMQMICEAYDLLRQGLGLSHDELHEIFSEWNEGELDSYLIEITRDIMAMKDEDGQPLVTKILDRAGQKGTGKWTGISSLELGVPVTLIVEAVYARCLSALKSERVTASKLISGPDKRIEGEKAALVEDIRKALLASKIVSYAQGYMLMREAARENGWKLNYGGIALMWRGGCIIRSVFLGKIKEAFERDTELNNLLIDPYFNKVMSDCQSAWRRTVARAVSAGIPVPAMSSALAFFDGYRSEQLPANLLQAQRDYFGAHTYERIDQPQGRYFHTNWTGTGGNVASTTYQV
ncbi:MAG: decarboxylating NADP(+)-dependent phosphogluconate dehydrogenase [Sphaerochaetaceae bacterium]|jgi:6-phosphogluconate dehydrogenase|nr:decarboxylating NADP(+)-dependent phosphogluconate dehydrogenase [Sphaerochaetaceae bacterium]MDX9809780.1 decarboxylating NADP(+)-dependent phosphogluconate dehydrogenase [Sphaerochaetaceae bacterium]NLV85194.1 decarboxylating NADP(+)-dependent phosphogluconate dehydrogenase [Spirochaetales bacterium]